MRKAINLERQGTPDEVAKRHRKAQMTRLIGSITAALVLAAGTAVFSSEVRADHDDDLERFTVDVATDLANYKQINVDGKPGSTDVFSQGDIFIMNGTVYPGGSIVGGVAKNNPTDPGSTGKYLLRGTYTQDLKEFVDAAAHKQGAAPELAFATELFTFRDGSTILTDGLWPNAYFSARRHVLGGTGRFRDVVGEVTEDNIGENALGACNLRVTFHLRRVKSGR